MSDPALYTVLLLVAAAISATCAAVVWERARRAPGGPPLLALLLALLWWSLSYALYWAGAPAPYPSFWMDLTYLGVVVVPWACIVFALRFSNRHHLLTRRNSLLLAVVPLLTLVSLFTDDGNGLFFGGTRAQAGGAILMGGPAFWLSTAYDYVLLVSTVLLMVREFFRVSGFYRRQVGVFITGLLVPWAANMVGLLGLSPFPSLDPTPVAFTISGLCLATGLLRYQLLDVVPVARHILVEQMSDGVLVVDAKGRIVDANPALARGIGVELSQLVGRPAESAFVGWPALVSRYRDMAEVSEEIVIAGDPPRYMDLRIVPLRDQRGTLSGRLVVVRDSTDRRRAEIALREANTRLQSQLAEITELQERLREQAVRDPLTGLFNRRYLEETLARELTRVARDGEPLSVAVIDVDRFKELNDGYGHDAGDRVLQDTAALLTSSVRAGDVVSRYGGDEFVVVLPGVTLAQARRRAEAWRQSCEQYRLVYEGHDLRTSFSIGIATFDAHGDSGWDLLRAADRGLYLAKQAGRNRVVVCPFDLEEVPLSREAGPQLIAGVSHRN